MKPSSNYGILFKSTHMYWASGTTPPCPSTAEYSPNFLDHQIETTITTVTESEQVDITSLHTKLAHHICPVGCYYRTFPLPLVQLHPDFRKIRPVPAIDLHPSSIAAKMLAEVCPGKALGEVLHSYINKM
jgi:hypothetical protein